MYNMGTITINVKDNIEKDFRKTVRKKLGQGKGVLGRAVEDAIKKWVEEEKQIKIVERQMKLMEKGLYSLKGWKFNREGIYDRQ